jgi:hypothetical protein
MTITSCEQLATAMGRIICRRHCAGALTPTQVQNYVPLFITQAEANDIIAFCAS